MPNTRAVHVDQALTNVSINFKPTGFIADMVSPIIPVLHDSDKYYVWDRAEAFRAFDDLRAPGAEARMIDDNVSTATYSAEEYSLKGKVTDRAKKNADSVLRLEISKTNRIKNALMLGREKRVAALFTTAANYASTNKVTKSGTSQWNNGSFAGNPITDIDTGIEAVRKQIWVRPNVIIMPEAVTNVFKADSNVIELLKYTNDKLIEGTWLPKTIRGLNLMIPGAVENTANEGATAAISDIWGKHVVIAYVNYGGFMDEISFSYTFRSQNFETTKWYETKLKTTFIETGYMEDNKVVSNVAGYLIENVIA